MDVDRYAGSVKCYPVFGRKRVDGLWMLKATLTEDCPGVGIVDRLALTAALALRIDPHRAAVRVTPPATITGSAGSSSRGPVARCRFVSS